MNHFLVLEYKNFLKHCYNELRLLEMQFPLTFENFIYYHTLIKTIRFTKSTMTDFTVYETFSMRRNILVVAYLMLLEDFTEEIQKMRELEFPLTERQYWYYQYLLREAAEIKSFITQVTD